MPLRLTFRVPVVFLSGMLCIPMHAMHCQSRWTIEPNLRVGTLDEGPASFADIRGIVVGARGSIWVLEFKTQEIRMFDANGQFIKLVARRGGGPGEIGRANGMLTGPNGDVWVNDPANGRLVVFTPDGRYKAQHMLKGGGAAFVWNAMIDNEGVLNEEIRVRSTNGSFKPGIRRISPNGSLLDTLPLPLCKTRGVDSSRAFFRARTPAGDNISMSVPFLPKDVMAWDPGNAVWCSGGDRYEILRLTLGLADTSGRISYRTNPVEVAPAERTREIATVHEQFAARGFTDPDFSWIPRIKPTIVALDVDGTGRLWVRRSASNTDSTAFDIWNERGELQAIALAPFRISQYWHPLIRGDTLYAVTSDKDEVPYVVRAVIRP